MSSYLVGVLLGGFLPFSCYPFVIAAPCLIFLPLSLMLTDTPLWLTMQVCLVALRLGFAGSDHFARIVLLVAKALSILNYLEGHFAQYL